VRVDKHSREEPSKPVSAAGADFAPGTQHNEISGAVDGPVIQARDIANLHIHQVAAKLPTPKQLPPRPPQFVNRKREVEQLDRLLVGSTENATPPVVIVVGAAGVGKSATSGYWAHLNSGRFPDGQLYTDFAELRHRGGVSINDVLGGFLRALGLGEEVIPAELPERTALFRSRVADRRVLVVLDDVDQAAQVSTLIPGGSNCAVLATSRTSLDELVALHGAAAVRLKPLDSLSSEELLASMVGESRVRAEPEAVAELARICGGLPVALRICGAQLAGPRDEKPISWLTKRLADETLRLQRLSYGPGNSLQVVFDDAYGALPRAEAAFYRRLGLHPGPNFTAPIAAVASNIDIEQAEGFLDGLCHAHLVEDRGERFRFHDLLRTHACQVAERDETADVQEGAVRAVIGFLVAAAQRMDHAITPDRLRIAPAPLVGEPDFASPAEALIWFEEERPNLIAVVRAANERGLDEAWWLAEAMWIAYGNHKHFDEAREVYSLGLESAREVGNPEAEARMRQQLARAFIDLKRYDEAELELEAAERLAAGTSNLMLQASVIEFIGLLHFNRGEYPAAIASLERSCSAFGAIGYQRGLVLQEYLLGRAFTAMGKPHDAVCHLLRARDLVDRDRDALTYGRVLIRLGEAQLMAEDAAGAAVSFRQAASVMSQHEAPQYAALALEGMANVCRVQSDRAGEIEYLAAAVDIFRVMDDPRAKPLDARLTQLAA
jgi:tetratricopeptide (TPR) repeat protein